MLEIITSSSSISPFSFYPISESTHIAALKVLSIRAVILIGSIFKGLKRIANHTYHWIQDGGPHHLIRRRKERHCRERKFVYFMLASYGAQASWELRVHPSRGLATRIVLRHKEKGKLLGHYFINLFRRWIPKENPQP